MTFWNLKASEEKPEDGVLDIDGEIVSSDWFDDEDGFVCSKSFKEQLAKMKNVTVRINSPGGDVMAGSEIYSALREHSMNGRGKITVEVTALAASAASVIAMAGDTVLMSPTAYMMIHNPWTVVIGDAHTLKHEAKVLEEIAEGLINAYERRTGKSRDELKRMLDNETWMSAGTCVEEGFADGIIGDGANAAAMCRMDGSAYGAAEIVRRYETLRGCPDGTPAGFPDGTRGDGSFCPSPDGQYTERTVPGVPPDAADEEKRREIVARARAIVMAMDCLQ